MAVFAAFFPGVLAIFLNQLCELMVYLPPQLPFPCLSFEIIVLKWKSSFVVGCIFLLAKAPFVVLLHDVERYLKVLYLTTCCTWRLEITQGAICGIDIIHSTVNIMFWSPNLSQ